METIPSNPSIPSMFDPAYWAAVPFHFWSVVFFVFGSIVGSFLNVCIHRMPRGESIVHPPSHCPHCNYHIPWFLNIPLFTWVFLQGKCANCKAPISIRYFLVELLTAVCFLSCWLAFGAKHPGVAVVYCIVLAGFIVATFIDIEFFIIPDEITLGGVVVGFLCSFAVPQLHGTRIAAEALRLSFFGILCGAGLVYFILRLAKLMFGREKVPLPPGTKVIFEEEKLVLPDREYPYDEIFYRKSDAVILKAQEVLLPDRTLTNVPVKLTPHALTIGEESFDPAAIHHFEAITDLVILPREGMGLGDVKFMAGIGAFLGWKGVFFSLMVSSAVGAVAGLTLVALGKKELSSKIPYGPYIALAATIYLFVGEKMLAWWLGRY